MKLVRTAESSLSELLMRDTHEVSVSLTKSDGCGKNNDCWALGLGPQAHSQMGAVGAIAPSGGFTLHHLY